LWKAGRKKRILFLTDRNVLVDQTMGQRLSPIRLRHGQAEHRDSAWREILEYFSSATQYRSPVPAPLQWRAWVANPEGITGETLMTFVNNELFPGLKALPVADAAGDRRRVVRDVFEDAYNYMKSGQLMRQVINRITDIDFNNLAERQHFAETYEQILNDLESAGNAGEYYTPRAVTAFMADRIDPRPGEVLLDPACGTGGFLTCTCASAT
jgi:type I restriction enzyme M protein